MKPRELRHRMEKSARLLVTVQKYLPKVETRFADNKAQAGQLLIRVLFNAAPNNQLKKLGKDLESKGYTFTQTKNRWLGNIVIQGLKNDQPDIVFEIETQVNRLSHSESSVPEPYSFDSLD